MSPLWILLTVLLHYLLVFICRHWIMGVFNGVMTVLLGELACLPCRLVWPSLFSAAGWLRVRRAILVFALYKAGLFLVLGDSRVRGHPGALSWGYQQPGLHAILIGFVPQSSLSIWHGAPLAFTLTLVLLAYAALCLSWRLLCVVEAGRTIDQAARLSSGAWDGRVRSAIANAAQAISRPRLAGVPFRIVDALDMPTPFVIGLVRPRIVLTTGALQAIDSDALEVALRHELMHISRRDHVWRWILLWLDDVAKPTLIGPLLMHWIVTVEERLCDLGAIVRLRDAGKLVEAIAASAARRTARVPRLSEGALTASPGLRGLAVYSALERTSTAWRMRQIRNDVERARRAPRWSYPRWLKLILAAPKLALQAFLFLVLLVIIYTKFFYIYNVN